MKNLIVIGHPDKQSFCYNGIFKKVKIEIELRKEELKVIDLYLFLKRLRASPEINENDRFQFIWFS